MLIHGVSPSELLIGTMVPLQKDKRKAHHSSDNYRALTLGSVIGKLYDAIIIKQQTGVFDTSDLEFGFKDGLSTTMCTFIVKETISYYENNGDTAHVLLLDASKAFHRVNYCMLFPKIIDKGMCPLVVRLLLHMYVHQKLQVRWNYVMSNQFSIKNGVRQGGVTCLFGIYIDGLLDELKYLGIGCYIGQHFCGAAGCVDDIILLCPTSSIMRKLLRCVGNMPNYMICCLMGQKANYWCTTRRMLIRILK